MLNTLCIFGTRPEAIKLAPVIKALEISPLITNKICVTGQHEEMLISVLNLFEIKPDYHLHVMTPNQTLTELTCKILQGISEVFSDYKPDLVLVHGDTTTALVASLAAFYHRIPIAHVEAGLRTHNIYSPWPEEANRKLAASLSAFHFAPTTIAEQNLLGEGFNPETIHVTGNTVIDALFQIIGQLEENPEMVQQLKKQFSMLQRSRLILVTGHRRENFGEGFANICDALARIAREFPDVDIVYPVHLNPNVQGPVKSKLGNIDNIHLIEPVDYLPFVYLMRESTIILTDSGGIQEEAPALGKPVLVMREITERPEAVKAGSVMLVGTDVHEIAENVARLLTNAELYNKMSYARSPYGDGLASQRIVHILETHIETIKSGRLYQESMRTKSRELDSEKERIL